MRFITEKQEILDEIQAEIVGIRQSVVPVGLTNSHTEPGYLLSDGMVLLESEKDDTGFYVGGINMNGMYLRTTVRCEPVKNEAGKNLCFSSYE